MSLLGDYRLNEQLERGANIDDLEKYLAIALHISSLTPRSKTPYAILFLSLDPYNEDNDNEAKAHRMQLAYDLDEQDLQAELQANRPYLNLLLLRNPSTLDNTASSKSHGIYLLVVEPDTVSGKSTSINQKQMSTINEKQIHSKTVHYYVGKTRRTFGKRWSEHLKEIGVNHKVRELKEEGSWSPKFHILLDFALVPAEYRTATLLAGLEVVMNAILGATMEQADLKLKGLNVNTIDFIPAESSSYPEAAIIALYDKVLAFLDTGRDSPASHLHHQSRWCEILGESGAFMEEVYELSCAYIISICRGYAMRSTFERNNMPGKLAKYAKQIKTRSPENGDRKRTKTDKTDKENRPEGKSRFEHKPVKRRTLDDHKHKLAAAGFSPKTNESGLSEIPQHRYDQVDSAQTKYRLHLPSAQ